jgi:hypothetical protein
VPSHINSRGRPKKKNKKKSRKEKLALKGMPNPGFKIFHKSAMEGILSLSGIIGLSHSNSKNIRINNPALKSISRHSLVFGRP